jgi:integrase
MKKNVSFGKSGIAGSPFEVRWNENGKRNRKRFKIKYEALKFYEQLQAEYSVPFELQIPMSERLTFLQIKNACERKKIALADAVRIIDAFINPDVIKGCDWNVAIESFCRFCEKRNLRADTLKGYLNKLDLFQRRTGTQNVAEITQERAQDYITNISSPEHHQRVLRPFCALCVENGWLNVNPFLNVKIEKALSEKTLPVVMSIATAKKFFTECPTDWLPAFALMGFAGIRPMELLPNGTKEILKIGDIDFANKTIRIRGNVAKTRTERMLSHLPDNLWQWLAPLRNLPKDANISAGTYDQHHDIREKLNVQHKDIFRHSFASYGYHFIGAERTIEILRHERGFGTFAKHYKGLSNPETAKEYFSIIP